MYTDETATRREETETTTATFRPSQLASFSGFSSRRCSTTACRWRSNRIFTFSSTDFMALHRLCRFPPRRAVPASKNRQPHPPGVRRAHPEDIGRQGLVTGEQSGESPPDTDDPALVAECTSATGPLRCRLPPSQPYPHRPPVSPPGTAPARHGRRSPARSRHRQSPRWAGPPPPECTRLLRGLPAAVRTGATSTPGSRR